MSDLSSLVIRLSADVAQLQGDLGRANAIAQRSADQMRRSFDGAIGGMRDTVTQFGIGLASAFSVGAFVSLAKQAINTADEIGKLSQKIGVSAEVLSSLRVQAQLSDVTIESLQGGMSKLARNAADAATGSKQQAAAFQAVGISVKDAAGNLKPMDSLLASVATKFASYRDSAAKTALAQELFGKSGADLIPLLNQLGTQGFSAARAEAEKYGQVITGDVAKASEEFNDNLTKLKLEAQGFAAAVTAQLLPALNNYTGAMVTAGQTNESFGTSATVVANAIKSIVLGFTIVSEAIKTGAAIMGAFYDAIVTSFKASAEFIIAWGSTVKETILGALTLDGDRVKNAASGFFSQIGQIGSEVAGKFQAIGSAVTTQATDSVAATMKAYDALFGTFANVSSGADTTAKSVGNLNAPLVANTAAAEKAAAAHEKLVGMLVRDAEILAQLRGELDPTAKVQQDYVKTIIEAQKAYEDEMKTAKIAGASLDEYARIKQGVIDKTQAAQAVLAKETVALDKQANVLARYLIDLAKQNALLGLTPKELAVAFAVQKVTDEWNKNSVAGLKNLQTLEAVKLGAVAAAGAAFELEKRSNVFTEFVQQFGQMTEFEKLKVGIEDVGKALDDAIGKGATDKIKELQQTLAGIRQAMVESFVHSSQDGLRALQSMTESGSKAFQAMQIAIDALTVVQAISAVLNQGQGDPYTAFARMAAMAAAVVALGVDIGNFGGGGAPSAQSAEVMQSQQGTGTVLGDATAKSESIAKATEITANATTQLVGLNRGMLTALQALQSALGAAGNQLARGAGDVQFAGTGAAGNSFLDPFGADPIMGAIGSWLFGGDQEVIDQGIIIAGGALNDMLNNIVVGAYQTIHTDGGLFGSDSTDQQIIDISEEFGRQFQLVIQSIADTVREGAIALGLLPADVEAAIAAYQVAEVNISLQGLSAEDQQKALEAVFSSIFDGLAGAVVPFIEQFQKVGEGLGETLVRIATEVQVTQEAFKQLGLSVAETDPEKFAQISEALITAAGGLDDFISGMQSFVANFSSSLHQLDVSSTALSSAFEQVGLTVPATRDGMWDLMQSLDATTEAGQAQIATLLRLADTANAYYDQLDEFASVIGLNGESDFHHQLTSIRDAAIGLIDALSKAGASTETLQHVYDASVAKINELVAEMQASAQSLAFSLGLTNTGSLDDVNAEIARLQSKAGDGATAVRNFGSAMQDAAQRATEAINLLLGNLSPLNDQAKLQTALAGLRAGTVSQDQVLEIGRRLYASSQSYKDLFAMVQSMGRTGAIGSNAGGAAAGTHAGGLSTAERNRLTDLLAEQQQLQAAATLANYQTLAKQIAEIAAAKGEDWRQVVEDMGINIADFEAGLGMTDDQTQKYIEGQQALLDDNNENTLSIIQAINDMSDALVTALGRTPGDHSQPGEPGASDGATATDGHSGHARPGSADPPRPDPPSGHSGGHQAYRDGQEMARGFRDVTAASLPRSARTRVPA